ncbi:hypothetical protein [Thauera sp. WH-1]
MSAAAVAAAASQAVAQTAPAVEAARRESAEQGVSAHMRSYYRTARV